MNKFARFVRQNKLAAAVAASPALLATKVHAALPAGAEDAIETYGTDVVAAISLMIVAGISIFAVRKLGAKMGWL